MARARNCVAALACCLVLLGVSIDVCAAPYDHKGLARQALEAHIRPGYAQLIGSAKNLVTAMEKLCSVPGEQGLSAARDRFRAAAMAWARMEHIRFGPVAKDHRYERLGYWPDHKGLGRRQVARAIRRKDPSVLDPSKLARKSVALQGLTALEVLLHGTGSAGLAGEAEAGRFRCRYGHAIARNIHQIGSEIVAAWAPEGAYARLWLAPGGANRIFHSQSETTLELVKSYQFGLELVREAKLISPLGMKFPGQRPTRPQYDLARLSVPAFVATLEGVRHLYDRGGLGERLKRAAPDIAGVIDTEFRTVEGLIGKLTLNGPEAYRDETAQDLFISMGFPLKNIRNTGGDALAAAAGLSIGFNAGDGD